MDPDVNADATIPPEASDTIPAPPPSGEVSLGLLDLEELASEDLDEEEVAE
jgi:hypothetical protein